MSKREHSKESRKTFRVLIILSAIIVVAAIGSIYFLQPETTLVEVEPKTNDADAIVNGVHVGTGFIDAPGMQETINNCTNCHSAQLVIQNRMNADRWKATIRWMQETQNLWDLGPNEDVIINYLVKNYPPSSKGRREGLTNIVWYELKD